MPAAKPAHAASAPTDARLLRGQAAERLAEAERGKLPQMPDFTADIHIYLRAEWDAFATVT